jgi:signal transduction histidine kinase
MRRLIFAIWFTFALISIGVAMLLFSVYENGEQARVARGLSDLRAACEGIGAKYNEGLSLRSAMDDVRSRTERLDTLVSTALVSFSGVEGGLWSSAGNFIGYGYPTYGGTTPKTDIPQAEMPVIAQLAADASAHEQVRSSARQDARETVLVMACPLPSPPVGVVAWTLVRIQSNGPNYTQLMSTVAALLAFVLVSGISLGWTLHRRSVRFTQLEKTLESYSTSPPRTIPATGDADVDGVVAAVNALGARLATAQQEAESLNRQVAQSERLAALGRLSAALAHEIRNPLAAIRLKIENAQAPLPASSSPVLDFTLTQVARLENLVKNLLAMTQVVRVNQVPTAVDAWIDEHLEAFRLQATARGVALRRAGGELSASFDPFQLGRALDNLIVNAIEQVPSPSELLIEAKVREGHWILRVRDDGPGIPPAIRAQLFEPFVSGRAEGTGLGLATVRDIVRAHGGTVVELEPRRGACFQIELPCHAS